LAGFTVFHLLVFFCERANLLKIDLFALYFLFSWLKGISFFVGANFGFSFGVKGHYLNFLPSRVKVIEDEVLLLFRRDVSESRCLFAACSIML
jgi:hypothetical protein